MLVELCEPSARSGAGSGEEALGLERVIQVQAAGNVASVPAERHLNCELWRNCRSGCGIRRRECLEDLIAAHIVVGLTRCFACTQAEKTKQESRSKDESARRLEEKLQAAEAKLKAKEQMCQALSDKVGVRRSRQIGTRRRPTFPDDLLGRF